MLSNPPSLVVLVSGQAATAMRSYLRHAGRGVTQVSALRQVVARFVEGGCHGVRIEFDIAGDSNRRDPT